MALTPNLLQGKSVRLAALTRDDLPTIVRWHENADFLRLYGANPVRPQTVEQLENWLEEHQKSTTAFLFAIRPTGAEGLLGFLELDGIEWAQRVAWYAIAIGDSANWDKGYGSDATALALRYAFNELNLRRVQLTAFAYNERAIAMYEKLGFVREGAFREFLDRDGQRYDMYLYGILRREWESRKT